MANIALSPDFALISKNITGIERVRCIEVTFDPAKVVGPDTACTYTTGGVPLSLGSLGMRRVVSVSIAGMSGPTAGTASTSQFIAEWNGSRTAPKIALYTESAVVADNPFTELSSGAVLPAKLVLTLLVRGA